MIVQIWKAALGALAALALLGTATVAPGQTGTRIQNNRTVEAPEAGRRFADCLAEFNRPDALAYLATQPGSPASEAAWRTLIPFTENRCVQFTGVEIGGRTLHVDPDILRGQLSQALYLGDYPNAAPVSISGAEPGIIAVEVYNHRIRNAASARQEILQIFGDCVVAAQPMDVDALIRSDIGSRAENAAIGAIGEAMGPCLWEGQSIAFSRESLRAALAAGLYRKSEGRTVMAVRADAVHAGSTE
ncbi:MAG: hypothetical protein HKN78_04835 [Sphingomonadaceae bacterium]|nr:hypothetical protein [Sphingomonadaceae bacterium]